MIMALGIQYFYNNSVPEMSKDPKTGKERINKISYGTASSLLALISLILITSIVMYNNSHLDK